MGETQYLLFPLLNTESCQNYFDSHECVHTEMEGIKTLFKGAQVLR